MKPYKARQKKRWNMNLCRRILCGHWRFRLEEEKESGEVLMRIRGIRADGSWITSSPVTDIYVTDFGLEVWTKEPEEVYGLRSAGYGWWSLRRGGLWGKEREEWERLVGRLPKKQQIFAWMWQDPLCSYIEDYKKAAENIRITDEWKNRHRIEAGSDSLYTIALCLKKTGQVRGWTQNRDCPVIRYPWGIFLCFHEEEIGFYETWESMENHRKWGYACVEEEEENGPLICARSRWTLMDSLETLDISVSYRVRDEDQIELVRAIYRWVEPDGTIQAGRGMGRMARPYIYLYNVGENSLFAGGIIEKTELLGNYCTRVYLQEPS